MTIYQKIFTLLLFVFCIMQPLHAAKLGDALILDQDHLMLRFENGVVEFVDDGLGENAYSNHSNADNSNAVYYEPVLDRTLAAQTSSWVIKSDDDANYGETGLNPTASYRKGKVNGMSQGAWGSSDWIFDYTFEQTIYLELPFPLQRDHTYTLELDENLNSDINSVTITFDIFNSLSEAIHTNLVGYMQSSRIKSADLYHFMGDGGNRDYAEFAGNDVYIYNVDTGESEVIGTVEFWMENKTETNHNLTGSDVWNVDFTGFNQPGTFRLAVEGVGCSQDFEIRDDIYHDPYKLVIMGYFYMRIGQDNLDMTPVPRRPLWIQDQSPYNCKIYVTDMHPYHPEWDNVSSGDKWDAPSNWVPYKLEGNPTNPLAIGGHSDALDWDRHLGHVTNIYDLCLAYIVSNGVLDDDDLRIAESGNGIPDILDEVRNEVDFWLNLRYGAGYSHGLTNPDDNNALYQAGNTPIAAWANALNSAMMAYCFQIAGQTELRNTYLDSAVIAFNYAGNLADQMLDTQLEGIRGRDLKMNAAAYLFNLTGDTSYEDIMYAESMVTDASSNIYQQGSYNQIWGTAAYLLTQRTANYPDLQANMKSSIIAKAKTKEADRTRERPSRRGYSTEHAWWQTNQDMTRTVLAHAVSDNPTDQLYFLDAMLLEADWGLGRNPLNMIQMTTATTELADKRSVENCYTTGQDDGTPGLHPGHTPYLNTQGWGGSMAGSNPQKVLEKFYPDIEQWPHASKYINTRDMWAHSEFTPRQTMRGKAQLYAYLYSLSKSGGIITENLIADAGGDQLVMDKDENGVETIQLNGSKSYTSNSTITSYKWLLENSEIATGKITTVNLDTGRYEITLEIEDQEGQTATDQVIIEIIAPVSEESDYGFETDSELDDWAAANLGEGGTPTAVISTEQAHRGTRSAKLSGDFANNTGFALKRSGPLPEKVKTIIYYVWVPQAMVDASVAAAAADISTAGGLQSYLMYTGWQWRDTWTNIYDLEGDAWNKIEFDIPDDVGPTDILESGLACTMQNAGFGEGSIYIDDVTYQVPAPPADYDFETNAQFNDWTLDNWGSNGGTAVPAHSTDKARSGTFSYKITGNFAAESEHTMRRDSPVAANVESFTYHVWTPQVLVDSANAVWQRDSTRVGGIQVFLLHANWDWAAEWVSLIDLYGDNWTRLEFTIPENVNVADIQTIGLSYKTLDVNAGEISIYVDDVYFNKDEATIIKDDNNLADIPQKFRLYENYPNPFNPQTSIKFNIPVNAQVKLNIYDITGRLVKKLIDSHKSAGSYQIDFNASGLASGVYFYALQAGNYKDVRKMILIK